MECQHCRSKEVIPTRPNKHSQIHLYCKHCQNYSKSPAAPRVLLFDIETSHTSVGVWQMGEQRIRWDQIEREQYIISWAAKWLFSPDTMGDVVTPKESKRRDDKRIVKSIHKLMSEADCVITHNGDKFDIKKLNWKFMLHNLEPNRRYTSIDTLKKSREIFSAPSHAMDYLVQALGYSGKHEMRNEDWIQCEAGNQEALQKMYNYNLNDIFMLEDLYLRMRGWMKTHPNFAIFSEMYHELKNDETKCPRCTHTILKTKYTKRYQTPAGSIYKSCNCPHCGAVLRMTLRSSFPAEVK